MINVFMKQKRVHWTCSPARNRHRWWTNSLYRWYNVNKWFNFPGSWHYYVKSNGITMSHTLFLVYQSYGMLVKLILSRKSNYSVYAAFSFHSRLSTVVYSFGPLAPYFTCHSQMRFYFGYCLLTFPDFLMHNLGFICVKTHRIFSNLHPE